MHTVYCVLCSVYCILLYTVYYILYIVNCILYTLTTNAEVTDQTCNVASSVMVGVTSQYDMNAII
jgi:hypothetical protein